MKAFLVLAISILVICAVFFLVRASCADVRQARKEKQWEAGQLGRDIEALSQRAKEYSRRAHLDYLAAVENRVTGVMESENVSRAEAEERIRVRDRLPARTEEEREAANAAGEAELVANANPRKTDASLRRPEKKD